MSAVKRNIYERLALKERVNMMKKARDLDLLVEELEAAQNLMQQIREAIDSEDATDRAVTAMQLRSDNWFREKIMEQRAMVENRCTFLDSEVQTARMKLSEARHRHRKASDKALARRRAEAIEKEQKREDNQPKRKFVAH